jgi:hypothetical protein
VCASAARVWLGNAIAKIRLNALETGNYVAACLVHPVHFGILLFLVRAMATSLAKILVELSHPV